MERRMEEVGQVDGGDGCGEEKRLAVDEQEGRRDIARLEKVHTPHMHVDEGSKTSIVEEKLGGIIQTGHLDAISENSANAE